MNFDYTDTQNEMRAAVRALCKEFGDEYWRRLDEQHAYPEEFVQAMTKAGWLAALIPEEYGGSNLGILDASLILQEVNRCGGNGAVCHAQMYTMGSVLRHGSPEQKRKYLPRIADGSLRLQAFGVTEPDAGSNTLRIKTFARKVPGGYVINGQKIWTSRFLQSDLYLLITRTTPYEEAQRKTDGLTLFLVDIKKAGPALQAKPIRTMLNHHTNQVFIDNLEVSDDDRIGEEGKGFYYLLDSLNAERIIATGEILGNGQWMVERASRYAGERVVFDRPIGANQGVQFPIARAHMNLEAAELMRNKAAALFDQNRPCGPESNMAKYLASEAAWEAAEAAMTTYGGFGVACEYDIERKWKETRLFRTAPISNNLVLAQVAQHQLGMPRSY
ncbi:acyl-CoA dehydrogenase family protein [Extensimonas vulgaris]|uniref:Acyl-CoA dehydrogenase n=1 Tax=Extensimonas vulgaris TaxID=1031594 RepID=A0A369AM29_9BURK|nr:acyl-CoA dehydrogenase family protein [Extensimonas vulgaris]RCX10221.1 acyl-CoA dehydrogenase [Extensimonas vulgaris]TWI39798.1 acyl-CoA dehydrogenase [Extensimonas vulgaris]TXD17364.1 acyl-CoA dehydrogenase [Extensimonas vulgaris]